MIYTLTLNPSLDREYTIPAFEFDQVLRAGQVRQDFGGKGLNVSRALKVLGMDSTACGFFGGATGKFLSSGLSGMDIHVDVVWIKGESRTNVSIVTDDHTHYLKVNHPGPVITDFELARLRKKIIANTKPKDWWVLAGSLPTGVPPIFIKELITTIESAGARAVLDSEGPILRFGLAAHPFLVKPNAVETSQIIGSKVVTLQDAGRAVMKLVEMGARSVVVSMGKSGAVYFDGENTWQAVAPAIIEKNPIGAGDALLAGMLLGFNRKYSSDEVIRWGVASGAAAASLPGTTMGSLKEVESLVPEVIVSSFHTVP